MMMCKMLDAGSWMLDISEPREWAFVMQNPVSSIQYQGEREP